MSGAFHNLKVMSRLDLTRRMVAQLKRDEAVIGGIGNTNFDLWEAGQRPQNFYMLGSMGLAIRSRSASPSRSRAATSSRSKATARC